MNGEQAPQGTITTRELWDRLENGESLLLVETLPAEYYERFHLPGALNLPPGEVADRAPELLPDKDAEVVLYCTGPG